MDLLWRVKTGRFFKKFKNTKCRIYEILVTDIQYSNLIKIIRYMKKHKDIYKYDYLGIILRIPITFKNKYVCSYFVAQLLENANIYNFDKKTFFVKPSDFGNVNKFNLVYTCKYAMYR